MSHDDQTLQKTAAELVEILAAHHQRVVFAESCTGGLISAELSAIPGVSQWLCGSAVTYRCQTKVQWLGVSAEAIEQHTAVSRQVALQMASGVLANTSEASIAASITGHFGPGAPDGFDGIVFVAIATRALEGPPKVVVSRHQLVAQDRPSRQVEAAGLVLRLILNQLES